MKKIIEQLTDKDNEFDLKELFAIIAGENNQDLIEKTKDTINE